MGTFFPLRDPSTSKITFYLGPKYLTMLANSQFTIVIDSIVCYFPPTVDVLGESFPEALSTI